MQQNNYRPLTYDEKKAAEAAFTGSPFDPEWSEAARKVYIGLSKAMATHRHEVVPEMNPYQPTMLVRLALPEPYHRFQVPSPQG